MEQYIVIGIICLFFVFFLFMPKKKTNKTSSQKSACIARYNSYIDDLNFALTAYTVAVNKQLDAIGYLNSDTGINDLHNYQRSFKENKEAIEQIMLSIKDNIEKITTDDFIVALNNLGPKIDNLYALIDEIKYYEPKAGWSFDPHESFSNDNSGFCPEPSSPDSESTLLFFGGCETKEDVEHRFRNLSKAFHPDVSGGDNDTFIKLQEAYNEKIKEFDS